MKTKQLFTIENGALISLEKNIRISTRDCILFDSEKIANDAKANELLSCADETLLATIYSNIDFQNENSKPLVAILVSYENVRAQNSFNEAFLANLRSLLKKLELLSVFAFIFPRFNKTENFLNQNEAFVHVARRIKDCANVVGFAIPFEIRHNDAIVFKNSFFEKHPFYIFFVEEKNVNENIDEKSENENMRNDKNVISFRLK